ncbi:retrovirus-related pol polyprotein from transposon TNT 1-94 [Tanacetum coccineum]
MAFNDCTVDYDKLERKLNETLGLLAQKEIDIKEGLKLKAYEILVVKEKHDELVKQSLLTKSHFDGLVKEKTKLAHANDVRKKMWRKSFVKSKPSIFKNIGILPVSKSISKSRQAYNVITNNINHFRELVDQAWVKHSHDHFHAPTALDMEVLIKTCLMPLATKTQNDSFTFFHELNQEMHADLKYVESLENEIDELESDKAEFSNMYDILLQECMSNDVMYSYLHSLSDLDAHNELQCLYLYKVKECDCLAQKLSKQTESVSKEVYTELLRSFAKLEKHSISLELALQQCQEQLKNDTVCKEKASNVFLKEREQYFEIQDLKAQLQDKNIAISKLKKLIEKCKGKFVETKFDKPFVVRQLNDQRIPKPSVLGKPTPFSDSLERKSFSQTKSIPKTNVSEGLSKPVTTQIFPQTARQAIRNTNVIKPGMCKIDTRTTQTRAPQLPQTSRNTNPRVSTSTRVIHNTNVSIPQLRSTQMKDKVVPNNSQVKDKKTEVEYHPRISSISNKTKSVTACNDSLKSRTSNVNAVCATCGKCVINSNHDTCVSKFLNDVNTRTKKPKVVPISTRKPKSQVKKYVATPPKETIVILFIVDSGCTKHMTGNLTVYYVEGLNHNLFSVGQFYDADLEVAFQKSMCFVRDLQGNDLLTGNRGSDLYTISIQEMTSSTPIYLMAKALPTQAWLWHRRLSYLNFDYINLLSKKDVVIGLPKLKYVKDQLCSSCEVSKEKRSSFKTKTLHAFFKEKGIEHQTFTPRTPEQNGAVERRNRTLVEVARTMLSASKLPLFFWAKAIATACYTQNRSIIILTHEKTAYHIINDRKPSIRHLYIFGCTCYLTRDGENLDKMKEKGDTYILVGYSTQSKGYNVYNKRTRLIVESIHLRFDEIKEMSKASDYDNSGPVPQLQNVSPSADTTAPSQQELDLLFGPLYDEFFHAGTSSVNKSSSPADYSKQQDTPPTTNSSSSTEPTTPTNVNDEENGDNQARDTQF